MKKIEGIGLVIFSGGQDSTTCLYWAKNRYEKVEAITFNYGQKHAIEIEQSKKICEREDIKQTIIDISFLNTIVDSALTSSGDVNQKHSRLKDLPASFVPNRNQLFITLAHSYAQKIGAKILVTGVCETDFSGYLDCRREFIDAIQYATNLGSCPRVFSTFEAFYDNVQKDKSLKLRDLSIGTLREVYKNTFQDAIEIITPLMHLNKAQTFQLAKDEGCLQQVVEDSHTCYNGIRDLKHDWGKGCGTCPACILRQKGYREFLKENLV